MRTLNKSILRFRDEEKGNSAGIYHESESLR